MRCEIPSPQGGAPALIAHGVSPGLVDHFVKRAPR
jgi:homospermidine synthase